MAAAGREEQSREEEEWSGFCLQIVAPVGILMAAGFSMCLLVRINMHCRCRCAHMEAQHLAKVDVKDARRFGTSEEERRQMHIFMSDASACSQQIHTSALCQSSNQLLPLTPIFSSFLASDG